MKKFISVFIIITLLISSSLSITASIDVYDNYLSDIDMHWSEEYIQTLYDMEIMLGYEKKSNPEDNITRGEFIALITRYLYNLDAYTPTNYFSDVKNDNIFFKNVSIAKENELINGDNYNNFNPSSYITREEIVLIISRVLSDKSVSKALDFNDITSKYIYYNELSKVYGLDIITGDENKNFLPNNFATRAECAKMLLLTIKNYQSEKDEEKVIDIAKNYLLEQNDSIGTEKIESEYKNSIISYAQKNGLYVNKEIKNINYEVVEFSNNTATIEFAYEVSYETTYSDNTKIIRDYDGTTIINMLYKHDDWYVYKTDESNLLKEEVNLTWDILNSVPDYSPKGVNVLSPVWYEIIDDNSYNNSQTILSNDDVTLKITDKSNTDYLTYAKNNDYELWIAYRNDFNVSNTEKFLNSIDAKEKAIEFLIKGVISTKSSGINIDFENMSDKYAYTNHVRDVALAMRSLGLITSVDINQYDSTSTFWSLCYDRDALSKSVDYVMLMAYDQNGTWSKTSGPVAGLSWVEDVIETTLKEVVNKKLVLGMPFYVRVWKSKNGNVVKTSAVSMETADELIETNNANVTYDSQNGQNVAKWSDDEFDYVIYVEDSTSFSNRMDLFKKYNLAGAATWRRGFEKTEIWDVIFDKMT